MTTLGKNGRRILLYLQEEHSDRYHELLRNGTLIEKIKKREEEIDCYMLRMADYLESHSERPDGSDTLKVVQYFDYIYRTAEELIQDELYKPI